MHYLLSLKVYFLCLTIALLNCYSCTDKIPDPPPPNLTPYIEQARTFYTTGSLEKAIEICQNGLALDSTAVPLLNILASTYSAQGRYSLAIEHLEKMLHFQPDYILAYINLGGIYTKLGQFNKAEPHLLRALELDPLQSSVRRRVGELYLGTDRPAKAVTQFQQALSIYPNDATLYFYLGQALEAVNQDEDALQAFKKATTLDIGFGQAFYRLGLLARKTQRPQLATEAVGRFGYLQKIAHSNPDVIQEMKGLRASILNAPEDAVHHYNLGLFFLRHEYIKEALNKFAKVVNLQPSDVQFLHQIGDQLLQHQHPAAALDYYQAVLNQDPTYFPVLINAGNIAGRLQRFDEAIGFYRQATHAKPEDPVGWYHLGMGLFNTGKKETAVAPLQRAMELSPPDSALSKKIQRVLASLANTEK